MVKMQKFSQSKKKWRYAYLLTPVAVAEKSQLTAEFLRRKVAEYETLQAEIETLRSEVTPSSQSSLKLFNVTNSTGNG